MKQAFVSIVGSYVGCCVASMLRRRGYSIVGSSRKEDSEDIETLVARTVDVNDQAGSARLALASDVIVLCLLEDVRGADAVLTALKTSSREEGRPSHLLVLSTTMTWAKTKVSMSSTIGTQAVDVLPSSRALYRPASLVAVNGRPPPGVRSLPQDSIAAAGSLLSRGSSRQVGTASSKSSGRGNANINSQAGADSPKFSRRRQHEPPPKPIVTENDFLARQPPTGYLEHKRLEVTALSLQSADLSACVVGAGVPYGLGEGPLLRVFRDAWRAGDGEVLMPSCASGDNRLGLVHVLDLSDIVANLLSPVDRADNSPAPFPKPYILAVDGDGAQCTTKEMTAAIGSAFGGTGHTRAMGEEELEEMLVEDPAALALMMDVRFSNGGGVVADMVADGKLKPLAWSKGFVASARFLAQEFASSRSLNPIRAVVVGPPGGCQGKVCEQISQRYGIMRVDAKISADSVFEALGKTLPEPLPPDEKVAPPVKGKKGKDTKKGAGKTAEPSAEALTARAALSPTERLLHDMQAAFEAADVPLSEYTSFDSRGLARVLPPSVVARSARLLLDKTWRRWAPSGFILCDIPSHGDEASDLFAARCTSRPSSRGGPGASRAPDPASLQSNWGEFRPTHVVYLDAAADFIAGTTQQGGVTGVGGGGKETEATVRSDLERFFSEEQKQLDAEDAAALPATEGDPKIKKRGGGEAKDSHAKREPGLDDDAVPQPRWVPATIRTLQNKFSVDAEVIDGEQEDVSIVVDAVDLHLTGGEVPAFVWMLGGEHDGNDKQTGGVATAAGAEEIGGEEALAEADNPNAGAARAQSEVDNFQSEAGDKGPISEVGLMEVLSRLTNRDAKEVEARTRRHRRFLTGGVVPQVAAGLVAAAEARPEDPFQFLADYLIRAGRALQSTAEAEAALKYRAGIALLQEMEERDNTRALAA